MEGRRVQSLKHCLKLKEIKLKKLKKKIMSVRVAG
jgi:hypothetical protein